MSADALGSPKATVTAFWSKCATRPLLCKQIGGRSRVTQGLYHEKPLAFHDCCKQPFGYSTHEPKANFPDP